MIDAQQSVENLSKRLSNLQMIDEHDPMFKTPSKGKNEGKELAEANQVPVQRKSDEFREYRTTAHYSPDESDIACLNFDQNLEISEFPQNTLRITNSVTQQPNLFDKIWTELEKNPPFLSQDSVRIDEHKVPN